MDNYRQSLEAIYFLLEKCEVQHWKEWIAKDIELWKLKVRLITIYRTMAGWDH
jgi:predicted cupin superfamily sugar epimerase